MSAPAAQAATDAPAEAPTAPPINLWSRIDRTDLARTVLVAGCALVTAVGLDWPDPRFPLVGTVGLVVGCWPIAAQAWQDVRAHRMSMELSMLIAILAAASIGQWATSLVIASFSLAAEILEDLSMDRGRDALTDLATFLPSTVQVKQDGDVRTIDLSEVVTGQVVVIAPGARVPADGTVTWGHSDLDQSRITGESLPVDVSPGDRVFAGSVNGLGALEVRVEAVGTESTYGRIVETVRRAQSTPAPVQRTADRLAAWIVVLALIGAVITWLVGRGLTSAISVVVVAGACGIAAGTPLAVLAAMGRIARNGAFVKGGAHVERLWRVDTVIFDKTGTLTCGQPRVVDVHPGPGVTPEELLGLAATAELHSEHPLGRALVERARQDGIAVAAPDDVGYLPGRGVTAEAGGRRIRVGNPGFVTGGPQDVDPAAGTAIHISADGAYLGSITLADTVRESARQAVDELHAMGLRTVMLTGDRASTAARIAEQLGIDEVRAELLPDQKREAVAAQETAGRRTAMVGDGVNDAPALAEASVGIAMGSGTAVARHSADVVLISSDPRDLAATVRIARRARRIVAFNFAGTLVVDAAGLALAACGILTPILAALVHVGSETTFILNSARLIPGRQRRAR